MSSRTAELYIANFAVLICSVVATGEPWHGLGCVITPSDMEGPYYQANVPVRDGVVCSLDYSGAVSGATRLKVSGTVYSSHDNCSTVLPGAILDLWQANAAGLYDDHTDATDAWCRATIVADANGVYEYETDEPGLYGGRPMHIHHLIKAQGHTPLITQLYFTSDDRSSGPTSSFSNFLDDATVYAVRTDLTPAGETSTGALLKTAVFDVVLKYEGADVEGTSAPSMSTQYSSVPTFSPTDTPTRLEGSPATKTPTSTSVSVATNSPTLTGVDATGFSESTLSPTATTQSPDIAISESAAVTRVAYDSVTNLVLAWMMCVGVLVSFV